jgi:hypothetical protein
MQGANNQQQAAGQAATMQANQSLNALGQMGGIAGQQAGQQAQAVQGLNTAAQGEQGQILGAIGNQNNANVSMQGNINTANAGLAGTNMQGQQALLGGVANAAGPAAKMVGSLFAGGGIIQHYDSGGGVQSNGAPSAYEAIAPGTSPFDQSLKASVATPAIPSVPAPQAQQPMTSVIERHAQGQNSPQPDSPSGMQVNYGNPGANALYQGLSNAFRPMTPVQQQPQAPMVVAGGPMDAGGAPAQFTKMAAEGGQVSAMVSPGERYLTPQAVKKVEHGADPIKAGKKVPGKPKVSGAKNDYANDTVPATLEEGGIVLPRSVTQAKNPHWAAHAFVSQLMAKQGKSLPKKPKK